MEDQYVVETDEQLAAEFHQNLGEEWQMPFGQTMPWLMPQTWQNAAGYSRGVPQQKQRYCATYPNISRCRHGVSCSFAHSRAEVTAPLLTPEEEAAAPESLTVEFFTEKFKTMWCPIGAQHDWQACMYAHTYQDVRRPPSLGYGHQLCPYWNKKETSLAYSQRCPLGPRCPFAHGAKEQLYHPNYFRTLVCRDLQRRRCPRAHLCAFFHREGDRRKIKHDPVDYSQPLPREAVPVQWLQRFLTPPRFQEATESYAPEYVMPPMPPVMPNPMLQMTPLSFSKIWNEDHDSQGTESTAEECHEDAETSSSQAATHVSLCAGLTAGAEDWAMLTGGKTDDLWAENTSYFSQPFPELALSRCHEVAIPGGLESSYAAKVQAHALDHQKHLQASSESLNVTANVLSHLGFGDVAFRELCGSGREI